MQQNRYVNPIPSAVQPDAVRARPPALPAQWRCDLADDSLRWQSGVFALFGLPTDARIERRDIVEMYAGPSRTLLETLRAQAIAAGSSFTFEAQIAAADGVERWIRIVADTVVKDGRVTHLYGTKCDVTDEMTGRFSAR